MSKEAESGDRILYRYKDIGIGRYPFGWFICRFKKTSAKAKVSGVEKEADKSYYASLEQACRYAALEIADHSEAKNLAAYANTLREAVGDLAVMVKAPEKTPTAQSAKTKPKVKRSPKRKVTRKKRK